jgi:UDP-N-acetylmuramyl pentapeptide synthase
MEYWAAAAYRGLLDRTVFIGVTGSAGKTVTKELIAAVLGTRWSGHRNAASKNELRWVVRTILATRPWHSFCVVEVGASGPGSLDRPLGLLRPRIAVVTHIGDDHRSAFRTPDATAREKGKLVAALPPDGTAILNADDPRVAAMGAACAGRVITYGTTPEAAVRADGIRGAWPERSHSPCTTGARCCRSRRAFAARTGHRPSWPRSPRASLSASRWSGP